ARGRLCTVRKRCLTVKKGQMLASSVREQSVRRLFRALASGAGPVSGALCQGSRASGRRACYCRAGVAAGPPSTPTPWQNGKMADRSGEAWRALGVFGLATAPLSAARKRRWQKGGPRGGRGAICFRETDSRDLSPGDRWPPGAQGGLEHQESCPFLPNALSCRTRLAFAVDEVDEHAQPAQAAPVKTESQARQGGHVCIVRLLRQGSGLFKRAGVDDVRKV